MKRSLKKKPSNRINKAQFTDWLNTAIPFSVWRWSNKKHVIEARDYIFKEIGEEYRYSRAKAKDMDMLLVFLVNLWVGFCVGCPIQISLNKNKYSKNDVFGKVFFTYDRTIRILKQLERRGYLQLSIGYFTTEDKKETRIWGTEKLIRLFVEDYHFQPVGDVFTIEPENLVQLREEKTRKILNKKTGKTKTVKYSVPVEYDDTDATLIMKENLTKYNTLANEHCVTVKLQEQDLVSPNILIDNILRSLVSGSIQVVKSELQFKDPTENEFYTEKPYNSSISDSVRTPGLSVFSDIPGLQITSIGYKHNIYPTLQDKDDTVELYDIDSLLPSITHTLYSQQWRTYQPETALFLYLFYMKKLFNLLKFQGRTKDIRDMKRKKLFKATRPLADFGIRHLEFEIKKKSLHRVFNRGSLDFDKGGRGYGGFYQGIPDSVRKRILINGNETVEYDYSGLHIRMLYHQLGLEFTGDPYLVGDNSLRDEYKKVALISINAKRQGAHVAVRDALKDEGFAIADDLDAVQGMMKDFQVRHVPIKEFLFSGVGIDLQNKDSKIMDAILTELHERGITGLPIHDSVIVEKEHADLLEKLMIEKYQDQMKGFDPVVK